MKPDADIPAARRRFFGKSGVARVVNALLWLVFCVMSGTGLLLAFRMPRGGGMRVEALGLGRHAWGDWHTWFSYAFLVLIALHLALHWRWFWQVAAKRRSWPLAVGLGAGLLLMLALALQPIRRVESGRSGGQGRGPDAQQQMSCDGNCAECRNPCGK